MDARIRASLTYGRLAIAALALALGGACGRAPEARGITLLIESPPDSLDDRLALTANGQRIAQLIAPGLVSFNDQSEPVPDLAQTYRSLDAKTLEFSLRPGLSFHDGTPLTAYDVKATFDGMIQRLFPSPKADKLEVIERVEVLDPIRLRFHLKRPYAPILAELSLSIVPASRAQGSTVLIQDQAPIGAGPFRFVKSQGDEIYLSAFAGYYQGKPQIPELSIRVVRDETTRVLELLKGRADLAIGAISPATLPVLRQSPRLRVLTKPGTGYSYLGFNLRALPFSDRRVREAICHALDIEPIVRAKFHGLAEPATEMIPKSHWAYAPTAGCGHDIGQARRLLAEAGYGPPPLAHLRVSLKTSTDRFRKSVALVIQDQLAEAGIEVEVRSLEFGTFFNDVRKGNFQMIALKWAAVIEPDMLRGVFSSKSIPSPRNDFSGWNRGAYVNEELDVLLDRAITAEAADRKRLYRMAQEVLHRDLPYVPLWHEDVLAVASSRIENFEPSAQGFFRPLATARERP